MNRFVSLVQVLVIVAAAAAQAGEYVINEQFNSLDDWEPITFPKIDRHSTYTIITKEEGPVLAAGSSGSASGIRHITEFNVYDYPVLRWRWKVDTVYEKGNVEEKSGDDYPLRVYVMFRYDPAKASFGERVQYGLAKTLYGVYPPKSSLNYIWANRAHAKRIYPSLYTDRARMIILRAGKEETGRWLVEQVDIIDDYREAFGELPPEKASIAIMNDSDNTGEEAVSYMDFIQVLAEE